MWEDDSRYPIERAIMTKNDCCRANRRRRPTGIQVHSVGCKGTSRDRWRCWDKSGLKKCANAFIDTAGIMQTLDWDVRPWLSGSGSAGNANDTCVGFEICEPSASKDTPEAAAYLYGCVLYLCTQLCREYGIHPREIKCHAELHREGRASAHADVTHWWGKPGTAWEPYTMPRLRHDVADALGVDLMEGIDMTAMILKKGASGDAVRALQEMLNSLNYSCGRPDGVFGSQTRAAVLAFQKANGLKEDGIAGPNTLTILAARAAAPTQPELPEDDDRNLAPEIYAPPDPETQDEDITVSRSVLEALANMLLSAYNALKEVINHE